MKFALSHMKNGPSPGEDEVTVLKAGGAATLDPMEVLLNAKIKSPSTIYKQRKLVHQVRKIIPDYLRELENIVGHQHKYTKLGVATDSFIVKFRLDRGIISKYQFLIYYVNDYGEIVAINRNIEVSPCLMKVTAKWNQNQMVPGATASLSIETGANSICSLTAIDKAVTFMANEKPINDITSLLKSFHRREKEIPPSGRKTCLTPTRKPMAGTLILNETEALLDNQNGDLERRKRHVFSFSEDFDAYDTFNRFGITVITNLNIVTKPCYTGPMMKEQNQVQFLTEYEDHNEDQVVSIRSYFPETWLWELIPVSKSVQLNRHLPHTLTNWVTNVLCVSEEEGIGISDQIEITSFQSFFVEVLNPHSIKRGEIFYLTVHVSNYVRQAFPVRIIILLSEGLEVANRYDKLMVSKCFQKNSTVTHVVQLKATNTGSVTATVLAEVDNKFPEECGPETLISRRDVVLKKIHVESEGYPLKVTHSALLCTSGVQHSNNVSWTIQTPVNLVPDTDHTYISLNGDLLSNTIENLEHLLEVPSGCGEQIMSTIAPNLYILRYLKATDALKHSMKQRIVKYLKIGYQRILNYAHKDGSFSAFGYHDPAGSMFLTAFVVRILQAAKQHIYVDQRVINKAVDWILEHQLENGCFDAMFHVFQDMGGTSKENSTASLTSYVIVSLLESNVDVPELVQTNAKYCIRGQQNPDKYTLAISCYALYKMNWYSEANKMLTKLLAVSEQQSNMIWWQTNDNESSATDIEVTSYVLLSLLSNNNTYNLAKAHSVVRWLSSKFGPTGAFRSSQDTAVALDALTKYFQIVKSDNVSLTIDISSNNYNETVKIESCNKMKNRRISLEKFVGELNIVAKGEGCVLAQFTHVYHVFSIPKTESFQLAVDVSPVSTIDKCSIVSVTPCLAYKGPDEISNMAVMEVSLPTGYEADRASLYKLVETEGTTGVNMFEELDQKVNLYLTKLSKQLMCFEFNLNKYSDVENMRNASIKLFDYYKPEYEILEFYKINENCNMEEIATLIPTSFGAETNKEILTSGLDNLTSTSKGL